MDINERKPISSEFYTYGVTFSALASGTDASAIINIEADSYFKIQKLTYQADIAAAAQTDSSRVIPNVSVIITDTGSGRQLSNVSVPIVAFFGTGEMPFILPTPKVFKPSSSISVKVSNFDAAVTYNLRLSFHGAKLWYQ